MSGVLTQMKTGATQPFSHVGLPRCIATSPPVGGQQEQTVLSLEWLAVNLDDTHTGTQQCPRKKVLAHYITEFTRS